MGKSLKITQIDMLTSMLESPRPKKGCPILIDPINHRPLTTAGTSALSRRHLCLALGFPIVVYLEPFDDLYLLKGPQIPLKQGLFLQSKQGSCGFQVFISIYKYIHIISVIIVIYRVHIFTSVHNIDVLYQLASYYQYMLGKYFHRISQLPISKTTCCCFPLDPSDWY